MEKHIYKSQNKTLLLYHLVFPAKYRRKVLDESVDKTLNTICLEISDRYANDLEHVYFLVESVPILSITKIVTIIKSIIAREIFSKHPEVKKILWGR